MAEEVNRCWSHYCGGLSSYRPGTQLLRSQIWESRLWVCTCQGTSDKLRDSRTWWRAAAGCKGPWRTAADDIREVEEMADWRVWREVRIECGVGTPPHFGRFGSPFSDSDTWRMHLQTSHSSTYSLQPCLCSSTIRSDYHWVSR